MKTTPYFICFALLQFASEALGASVAGEWIAPGIECTLQPDGKFHLTGSYHHPLTSASGIYALRDGQIMFSERAPRRRTIVLSCHLKDGILVLSLDKQALWRLRRRPLI